MNWRKYLWSLWAGCMISSSCYTMLLPFLPLYLLELGAPAATISMWSGFVFSATFFVSAVMSPYWGRQADKAGKRAMLLRAGFSLATVYLLGAFVDSPLQLFLVRTLQGFATGFVPAALAIVTSTVPKDKLGFSLGLMQTATLTGTIIGPLAGGLLSHIFGMRASFVVASLTLFLGTIVLQFIVKEPAQPKTSQSGSILDDFKTAFTNKMLLEMLVLLIVAQLGIMALQPLIALYVAELQGQSGETVLAAGFVFGLTGIAGAIAAPLWGRLGHNAGFINILIFSFLGAGLLTGMVFFAQNIWIFSVLQFVFGIFIAGIQPAVNTLAVMNTEEHFRGRVFGLTMSANQLGSMLGPLLGGIVAVGVGIKLTFVAAGLFFTSVAILLWQRHKKSLKSI